MNEEQEELKIQENAPEGTPQEDKKDLRNLLIIIGVVVVIFAIAMGSFKLLDKNPTGSVILDVDTQHEKNYAGKLKPEEGYLYNGFSFVKVDGLWWTERKIKNAIVKIPMHFSPRELEEVKFEGKVDPSFNNGTLYFAIDPTIENQYYTLALAELSFNVVKGVNRDPQSACTQENPVCGNHTILNCAQPKGKAVIELVLGEKEEIKVSGTCIKITGKDLGLVRAVDRLLYNWYGIMP